MAGARASTRRFLLLAGVVLLWGSVVVVDRAAAWLGPVWGRHGCAAALFGAVSEAGSEAPSWRPCDATLANVLRPSAKIATSKPHGGGDGPRLALVVDRRPLQLRVALVIGVDSCLLGASRSRGNTPTEAYFSAEPDESNNWRFWACRARRASGVWLILLLGGRTTPWQFLQAARHSPRRRRRRT